MSLLTARQITLPGGRSRRRRRPLLEGLEFTVEPGQCWLLRGPHGSGKSALLAAVAGVSVPAAGELRVLGEPAGSRRAAQALGWAPERCAWPDEQRVQDAVAELAALHTTAALGERVQRALRHAGLEALARVPVGRLSAGQRRALCLALALLDDPPLLLLDGQLDGLDADARASLLPELAARLAEGAALLVATHDPARLAALATHELELVDGRGLTRALRTPASAAEAPW